MVFESFSQILDLRLEQVQRREIPIRSELSLVPDAKFDDEICHGRRLPRGSNSSYTAGVCGRRLRRFLRSLFGF
jgi:hypothetical protein